MPVLISFHFMLFMYSHVSYFISFRGAFSFLCGLVITAGCRHYWLVFLTYLVLSGHQFKFLLHTLLRPPLRWLYGSGNHWLIELRCTFWLNTCLSMWLYELENVCFLFWDNCGCIFGWVSEFWIVWLVEVIAITMMLV